MSVTSAGGAVRPSAADMPWGARLATIDSAAGKLHPQPSDPSATPPSPSQVTAPATPRLVLTGLVVLLAVLGGAASFRWLTLPPSVAVAEGVASEELGDLVSEFESQGLNYRLDREGTRVLVPRQEAEKALITVRQVRQPEADGSESSVDGAAAPAQTLLDQVYGAGRTSVRVNVERSNDATTFERRAIDTDPASRVATDSDSSLERYQVGADTPLPTGQVDCPANQELDNVTRYCKASERNRYEISEQRTEGTRAAGSVKRMTVAVAVDQSLRPKVNLSDVEATVGRALGLDVARGDSISVAAVPFAAGAPARTAFAAAARPWDGRELEIAAATVLVGVTLALALPHRRRARS